MSAAPILTRPGELAALDLTRSLVIEASAGTGKTYLLEHLVLELLITGRATLEQILVVTFTERATTELVARVRQKIDQALAVTDPAGVSGWVIDAAARANLAAARRSFDRATIATIHAFCQGILTDEPLATRRLLGQQQVDGRQVFADAFREVLRRTLAVEGQHRPYLDAYLANGGGVDGLEGLLFAAAAGRGRWTARFDEDGLRRAVDLLAGIDIDAPGFMDGMVALKRKPQSVREHVGALKARTAEAAKTGAWGALLAYLEDAKTLINYLNIVEQEPVLPPALEPFRAFAVAFLDAAPPLEEAVAQRFLPLVEAELGRRKLAHGLYDYDDMINGVDRALAGEAGEALVSKLRRRYRFALIDEAQDTEPAQWRIFKRVFLESDGPNPVVLIGDPKQAIYGFRGADVHTYVTACRDIAARGGGQPLTLTRNHRAHPEVLDPVNALLDQRTLDPFFKEGDITYDQPVVATRPPLGTGPGVTLLQVAAPADGKEARIGEIRAALRGAIAREILALQERDPSLRLADIAVLTRSNVEGQEVAARLRLDGISTTLFRAEYLFKSAEAHHVRVLLSAIADPEDRVARMNAWLTPFFDVDLAALAAAAESLVEPPAEHPWMQRLTRWHALAEARDYARLWPALLDESGLGRRLRLSPAGLRPLTNYRHVLDRLQAESAARPVSVGELAAALATFGSGKRRAANDEDDNQRLETETDAVRIMTIHAAKGLEAEVVFVYGGLTRRCLWKGQVHQLHDGTERLLAAGKPLRTRTLDGIARTRREEERRLQYVALTRARRHLYLPFFPATAAAEPLASEKGDSDVDAFTAIRGEYRHVNDRLRALDKDPARRGLFAVRTVPLRDAGTGAGAAATPLPGVPALAAWVPPPELLSPPAPSPDAAGLRARRRGFLITSYSRLKESAGAANVPYDPRAFDDLYDAKPYDDGDGAGTGGDPLAGDPVTTGLLGPAEAIAPDDDPFRPVLPGPPTGERERGGLPGGAASGLFLHGVLEKVNLGPLPPLDEWQRRPEVRTLLENELRRWDRDPRHLDEGAALVHAALTVPLELPGGVPPLAGIARATRVRREVGFLFPLPAAPSGFVRGFLDVLFEHDGRVWFADWKSDVLPRYDAGAVTARVRAQYQLQVQIYTLATARLLGIRDRDDYQDRFGGMVYLFLRGLGDGPGAGLHAERPSYDEVLQWESELAALPVPGLTARPGTELEELS